ncbi:MAG: hypothetical protein H7X77_10460 [Anaerolineae bacterium]|nr:hypothetical protein [Anaerolineae bacterium]
MAETTLASKLYLKPGYHAATINAPQSYLPLLGDLPTGTTLADHLNAAPYDFIQLFVHHKADLDTLAPKVMAALKPGGTLWFSYPKKTGAIPTDITRDIGWETVTALGWGGVRQVSIDATWSALQFKPESAVKRKSSQ